MTSNSLTRSIEIYKAQLGRLIILNIQQTPAPQQSAVGGSFMTNFEIPKKFTKRTMEALEKGQITKAIHLISATHPTPGIHRCMY